LVAEILYGWAAPKTSTGILIRVDSESRLAIFFEKCSVCPTEIAFRENIKVILASLEIK
jgi:hypothetical protein